MSEIGKRVRIARQAKGLSQAELAELVEVSQVTIQQLESGRNKGTKHLLRIARALDVSADWLETGHGPAGDQHQVNESRPRYTGPSLRDIPVIGTAKVGTEIPWPSTNVPAPETLGIVTYPTDDKNAYALKIDGDSARFRHGEFIIVEPDSTITPGDEVLVTTTDGLCLIGVMLFHREQRLYIDTDSQTSPSNATFRDDQVKHLHYIAGIAKQGLFNDK